MLQIYNFFHAIKAWDYIVLETVREPPIELVQSSSRSRRCRYGVLQQYKATWSADYYLENSFPNIVKGIATMVFSSEMHKIKISHTLLVPVPHRRLQDAQVLLRKKFFFPK
jgi:hypothetical protein